MTWKNLLKPDIQEFIKTHENHDVKVLSLQKMEPDWPRILILDQIKSRQKASKKIPLWLNHHPDIIFPNPNILEQASSAATARYKAGLIKGKTFLDLTGGAGIDSCALTEHFENGICIEQNKECAELLKHNLKLLSPKPVTVECTKAEDFLKTKSPTIDLIYIDPARRDQSQTGLRSFRDCKPDITAILPAMKKISTTIMIKASPMLDIATAIQELQPVTEIHVIEWHGQCKEVLHILNSKEPKKPSEDIPINAVTLDDKGNKLHHLQFTRATENKTSTSYNDPQNYLYEPGPAFLKSGAFKTIAKQYDLKKIAPHTHLYTSQTLQANFPGKTFEILGTYGVNEKSLPTRNADLAIRNFPAKTEDLKKKLKLKSDNKNMFFACTLENGQKTLIHVQRV